MTTQVKCVCLLVQDDYKPGDLPPKGYLAWHEWAHIQDKAGLRQRRCAHCGLCRFPQELSGEVHRCQVEVRGQVVDIEDPICNECVAKEAAP